MEPSRRVVPEIDDAMQPNEPEPSGSPVPPAGEPNRPAPDASRARLGWGMALLAGTVAGLLAWLGGEWFETAVTVRIVSEFEVPGSQQLARRAAVITTKAMLAHGLLGGLLGLSLGLAGGAARRSGRGALAGAVVGLVLGTAAGGGAALVCTRLFLQNEKTNVADDMVLPLLTHGAIWSILGAASGVALGVGIGGSGGRILRAALGAVLGALVATMIYELLGGVVFPMDQTGQPISAGAGSRLFARLVVAVGIALGAARGVGGPSAGGGAIESS